MGVPHGVQAAGWIPFVVAAIMTLLFSFVYVGCFRHTVHWNVCATVITALGLAVSLATCALVPVDIFLVSFMKDSDGQFKPWAKQADVRESVENTLLIAYYVMYGCMILFLFLLLPFAFFFSGNSPSVAERCCTAVKFSVIFVLLAFVLFVVGIFVPLNEKPANGTADRDVILAIFGDFESTHVENAITLTMSVLTVVGLFPLIIYLGCGMAVWPIGLLKGRRGFREEEYETQEQLIIHRTEAERLRARHTLTERDEWRLARLAERERLIQSHEDRLVAEERSCWRRCWRHLSRLVEILFGILLLLLALLVFVSLLLINIDKILHSLGPSRGYILTEPQLINPIDKILVYAQEVFPLDYILIIGLILFLFFCAMSAIRILGIRCCCVQVFRISLNRTRPRGLLLLCFLLMFIVLSLNELIYQMAPQYGMFGSQKYARNVTLHGNTTTEVVPCSTAAPLGACVMTRMSVLLARFIYRLWFFGVVYYWASWVFLGMFFVALIFATFRRRRSSIEQTLSDDELVTG